MATLKKFIHGTLAKREERFLRVWFKNENKLPKNTTEKQLMAYTFLRNKNQLYYLLVEEWNKEQDKPKTIKIKVKKIKNFVVNMECEMLYKKEGGYYDEELKERFAYGKVRKFRDTSPLLRDRDPKVSAEAYVREDYEFEDQYRKLTVISYTIEISAQQPATQTSPSKQVMKRADVLHNDWLRFGEGIAETAYDNHGGYCVYKQLTDYMLNPVTKKPQKFLNEKRMNEDTLFEFFSQYIETHELEYDYPDFSKESGVSTEMIKALCIVLQRNMYAFDADTKLFDSYCGVKDSNYSPIVFYKLHDHFYLVNHPSVIKSMTEVAKPNNIKIISSTLHNEEKVIVERPVIHLEYFDVTTAGELNADNLYLVSMCDLEKQLIDFIRMYKFVPKIKTTNASVTNIQFREKFITSENKKEQRWVTVAIDVTAKEKYNYEQVKQIADLNNIPYINEGFGSLVLSALKPDRCNRVNLSEEEKEEFLQSYHHECSHCQLRCDKLEIDHILPLASGGTNEIDNLQPLCMDCHNKKTTEEKESGAYLQKDHESSVFNPVTLQYMANTDEFKSWAFVEVVKFNSTVYRKDLNKCRRNCMYYCKYEYPVFSVMDIPRPFTGNIRCGAYFVETTNIYPFRGNGWYLQPLIQFGLDNQLIEMEDIKAECVASHKLPADYFQKKVEVLLEAFKSDAQLQKDSVNTLVGCFGRTKHTIATTKFTTSPFEAAEWWGEKFQDQKVFLRTHELDEESKIYEGIFNQDIQLESTKYPIYKQILEIEAIELYKLEQLLIAKGAKILDRKTDAIGYNAKHEIDLEEYWDEDNTVLKYKEERNSEFLQKELKARCYRDTKLDMTKFELQWNKQLDYEGTPDEEAERFLQSNQSIRIGGAAGTGKSYLTNAIIKKLTEKGYGLAGKGIKDKKKRYYFAFSPTNKGARIIKGNTIHSIFYTYQSCKKKLFDVLEYVDYVFIDEVSMMIKEFYQLFTLIKRAFPKIKFIIAGDFRQLPPVCDDWEGDYASSPAMNLLCDGNLIELTKCMRSDDKLFQVCENADKVDKYDFKPTQKTYLNIAYTHKTRRRVNKECMERYIQEKECETVVLEADKFNPKTQDVSLAVGMPILAHKTNKKLKFMNSEVFRIKSIDEENIVLEEGITLRTKDFHKFFYVGFCMTIHASQGETFKDPYTIYDWYHLCDKARYVALSRGTKLENIQID